MKFIGEASSENANVVPRSRRAALSEMLGFLVVLAVPIGAVSLTAKPIPTRPSRETMNIIAPPRLEVKNQQRKEKKRRKAAEKQPEESGSGRDKEERRRARAAE